MDFNSSCNTYSYKMDNYTALKSLLLVWAWAFGPLDSGRVSAARPTHHALCIRPKIHCSNKCRRILFLHRLPSSPPLPASPILFDPSLPLIRLHPSSHRSSFSHNDRNRSLAWSRLEFAESVGLRSVPLPCTPTSPHAPANPCPLEV